MAKVMITITDKEDGTVNFIMDSEPAFPGPRSEDTPTEAQRVAVALLTYLQGVESGYEQNGETEYGGVAWADDEAN